ncbi:MAG: discoidin domain-containing protein [Myxococcota bacterium]|nr:discoidin domain-containing protein [Myxococcota bacterium]
MKKAIALTAAAAVLLPALAFGGAKVSSQKNAARGQTENFWGGNSAIDGNPETAWMVPGDSENVGEYIQIEVPQGKLDKIAFQNGWVKDEETFSDYARVKKMKVEFVCCTSSMGDVKTTFTTHIDLADTADVQVVDIENAEVGENGFGGWLKLSIVEVYEGRDFPSVAISELAVHMEEYDAVPTIDSSSEEDPEHITMDMMDDNAKSFFATPSEGAFVEFSSILGLSSVRIVHGPKTHDRVKKVKLTANNKSVVTEIPDEKGEHLAMIPTPFGYTGSAFGPVKMEVLEVYEGTSAKGSVAIAELKVKATNNPGF